ncbi:MAG: hypothetical protein SFU27_00950 [Thermonemataceae bacterium]|nr:hypothetical protein [Thermonemataceae bacterium]
MSQLISISNSMINKRMIKYFFLGFFLSLNFTACQSGKEDNNTPPKGLAESTATKKNEKNDNWEEDIEIAKPELDEKQKKGIMLNVVRQYCQSISEKDYKKLESLFADSIEQFNHLKATQKEKVTVYMRNFYQQKKNIKLMADYGAIEIEKNTIQIPIKFIWEKHQEEKLVKMGFDEAFNMISYEELPYQKKEKNKLKEWVGKYVLEGGRQEEAFLEVKALKNNKFSFELKLNENGDCKGSLEGNAIIISDNQASTIEIEDCKILFKLESDGQIKVEEVGECNRHIITCSFDGYYTKK